MRKRTASALAVAAAAAPASVALAAEQRPLATPASAGRASDGSVVEERRAVRRAAVRSRVSAKRRAERRAARRAAERRAERQAARRAAERRAARRARRAAAAPAVAVPAHLQAIAACESGGNPSAVSANGLYRGKYQFDRGTWASVGGSGDPAAASEAEQDRRAALLYARAGSAPWPVCGG